MRPNPRQSAEAYVRATVEELGGCICVHLGGCLRHALDTGDAKRVEFYRLSLLEMQQYCTNPQHAILRGM